MGDIASELPSKRKCLGVDCENEAPALQCPTCLKLGMKDSYFCSQDCFKKNWAQHKTVHKTAQGQTQNGTGLYNPFPTYSFTGSVRPVYPLSPMRTLPKSIRRPDWSETGIPKGERRLHRSKIEILDAKGQEAMRKVCRLAREVLDITAAAIKPGITTDYLDEVCHKACVERNAYPSPLNYNHFPKSLCTSPNEVVCHGIPDQRILLDGDILNLDISLYHGGYHADVNETYYVGDRAKADPDSVRVVETTRECLDMAIELVKPGTLLRDFGKVIEKHAKSRNCSIHTTWGGHGINTEFHPPPWIPHYANSKVPGVCKPGMAFTIEPILTLGKPREIYWPDDWTNVTVDGKRAAQFEHTLLVTETGVEVLTARLENSPGGPIPIPTPDNGNTA
ncbi:peptidase M24, structural domain-containing protein [Aspergillus pseudonomiae]|uniref:Methionine aminopeptidase n=1 Tax=Aspergillus pseudonomiae TaxID=1506151 RepID=A0A5N7DA80_9EURO|nr:peptidase M24, structural domain-containing protein [Aspergillus pseudonomiae]KAE8403247.1 peptidase M24, structural domain-containing protein [Aspergillus pseudonomiae]